MNVSRIALTTAVALSAVAAIGCSSTHHRAHEAAEAKVVMAAPPEPMAVAQPVAVAEPMPAPQVVALAEPSPQATMTEPPLNMAAADITERAPQTDRN
jgi:hypothetical protein